MNSTFSRAALRLHERITGRNILTRLEELNRTQYLSRDELLSLQQAKLIRLLEYAYHYVPYYQRTFDEVGFRPTEVEKDLSSLNKIPILTKDIIRKNFYEMLTTELQRRKQLSTRSTSGSTGQPLVFMQDSDFRDAVTADIQRHLSWGGWKLGDTQAFIWGARLNPTVWQMGRARLIDWVWNRFQLNAFIMTDLRMEAFAKRIHRERPRILFGYPTSIHRFAQFIQNSAYRGITFDAIFTSAEMLIIPIRDFIEETFQCRVFNRYGTLELGGLACECEAHNGYHISIENNFIEIIKDGFNMEPSEVGEIIVTNLNNHGMPFIRYNIEDAGAWHTKRSCPCGRASPMLQSIEGRLVDTLQTVDGRIVWSGFTGVAWCCLSHPTIKQFQVVQKSLDFFLIRLVPNGEVPQTTLEEIKQAFKLTFGEGIRIEFEFPREISPLSSGKHSYTISELNQK